MARYAITLFGVFGVAVDGHEIPAQRWRNRRAADLVKLLALEPGHALHREYVMSLLWPELPTAAAGANLRKAVHYARRALGSDEAVRSSGGLLFLSGDLDVDVTRFEAAAAAAADRDGFAIAAELYAGDLLPADRYEEWAAEPRSRLRDRYLTVLKGAGLWDRTLEIDPADEEAHRALMRDHLGAGRRREAIRQFERLRAVLRDWMGVGPDPTTIALYEQVLAAEGTPPRPAEHAAVLISTGLVHLNRGEYAEAEELARRARDLAIDAGLGHELGEASTLMALACSFTGRWHDMFLEEFEALLNRPADLVASYDANLCLAEYYLSGNDPTPDARSFASRLVSLAARAESPQGMGIAELMLGEALLLSDDLESARARLESARRTNTGADAVSGTCVALERLAQLELFSGRRDRAEALLDEALAQAVPAKMRSHLVVRLLGVMLEASTGPPAALRRAERMLADAPRVCEACALNYRVQASIICAQNGDLVHARRHLGDAERITALWHCPPWSAAVWEARAHLRAAEGHPAQAVALLHEAALSYKTSLRPGDERRCLDVAHKLG